MSASLAPVSAQEIEFVEAPTPVRSWTRAEFLLWRFKNDVAPYPLLTTGTPGDPQAGVLGSPGTRILYGDQLDYRWNAGGRLTLGWWLANDPSWGVEASGFGTETHTVHGQVNAPGLDGAPLIARPFFNQLTGLPDAQTITSPQDPLGGKYFGGIDIFGDSRTWGGEINGLWRPEIESPWNWRLLGGFRYLGQKDQLRFSQSSTVLLLGTVGYGGAPAPIPDIVSIRDYFETTNHYFGAQVGLEGSRRFGRWSLDFSGKIGPGATDQRQQIDGHTLLTDPTGLTLKTLGGLYATPDILGHHDQWHFAWASEFNVRLGFAVSSNCQIDVGYTFLYWDGVVRPANQLAQTIDPRQVPSNLSYVGPNPTTPAPFRSSDFWAQGISLGLTLRY